MFIMLNSLLKTLFDMVLSFFLFYESLNLNWWSGLLKFLWLNFWDRLCLVVGSARWTSYFLLNHLGQLCYFVNKTNRLATFVLWLINLKVHVLIFVLLAVMGSSRPRMRCSRVNSIFPKSLIIEATLRPPSIRSIFGTCLPSLACNWALCLYGHIIASSNLVDNLRGIDHSDLLIPLGKISLSLLLPVVLELFLNLLFILFMFVLANISLDQFVNSLFVLWCQSFVT